MRVHWAWLALLVAATSPAGGASPSDGVFGGPAAAMAPRLREGAPKAGGPLRVLTVEERLGVRRRGELVRVPLFFHAGECDEPNALRVVPADEGGDRSVVCQADDIRRDAAGRVARMHLYFPIDLEPWQRRQFHLYAGKAEASRTGDVPLVRTGDRVTLGGDDLRVTFWTAGPRAGGIADIRSRLGKIALPDGLLAAAMTLRRQAADLKITRSTGLSWQDPKGVEVRGLAYGTGPLFAELVVRVGPPGVSDNVELTYLVPGWGDELIQTERIFPSESDTTDVVGASDHRLLAGRLILGDSPADQKVVQVPAGLRRLTRSVHGHTSPALVNAKAGLSLLAVPWVQTGVGGMTADAGDGRFAVLGTSNFVRTAGASSDSLRAFWGEVRYVLSRAADPEELWQLSRVKFQPLVAVVDEPGLTHADLRSDLAKCMERFGYTHARDWKQEAGRLFTMDEDARLAKLLAGGGKPWEQSTDAMLSAARSARAKLLAGRSGPLKEAEKGRASGPLDPWAMSYSASPIVPLATFVSPSERLDRICLAYGQAQRRFNGRVDARGFPYVDCFATAANMQIGSYLLGIHAGKRLGEPDLVQFYRDCARAPSMLAIYGHGQRSYTWRAQPGGNSDLLYESTTDLFLRNVELTCNEDLWLHPSIYGRYFDCVDVNADLCHRSIGDTGDRPTSWQRANFFRGQTHDHRWESWAANAYLGLLAHAPDGGTVGLTDACYFTRSRVGRWVNWPEITTFFLVDIALRTSLARYAPEPAPPLPSDVTVQPGPTGNTITWKPPAGEAIAGYRVYRAESIGGPWTLLNSPHTDPPAKLLAGPPFLDAEGRPGQAYLVTAIDTHRRESRWFPDEPRPLTAETQRHREGR